MGGPPGGAAAIAAGKGVAVGIIVGCGVAIATCSAVGVKVGRAATAFPLTKRLLYQIW